MAIVIGCEGISHEWPNKQVLRDQTIGINEGDRIGIVGRNGDGKSTLLHILAKDLTPDAGTVTYRGGIHVGILSQNDAFEDNWTVKYAAVGDVEDYVWASDPKIREIIAALLPDVNWTAEVGTLSGGQRRRLDLARILIADWDVLLLDEPTNHLDMRCIHWLADHLQQRWQRGQGALLLITHDRWFLDEVATSMWEVHDGIIDPFEGGYSAYIQQRYERERQAAVMEERRQNILRKELNWLAHGAKARTSKPKFRIDAALELLANDPAPRDSIELKRLAVSRLGKQVIELHGVSFGYTDEAGHTKLMLQDIDWLIGPGERIGILGENGAGKSTLLKIMDQKLEPTAGFVKIGASVRFGILSQHLDILEGHETERVIELVSGFKTHVVIGGKDTSAEQLLERLGFDRKAFMSRVSDLSGGERRRLSLMCVLLSEPNVLILDEPGNDLDTDMLTVLEDLLDSWPGTLILVSHDRYLTERVCDDQFALLAGKIVHMPRGVEQYFQILDSSIQNTSASFVAPTSTIGVQEKSSSTLSNKERQELRRRFDAIERKLPKERRSLEDARLELQHTCATDFVALMSAQQKCDDKAKEIEALEDEWLQLAEVLHIDL